MTDDLSFQQFIQMLDAAIRTGMDQAADASLSGAHPVLRWLAIIYIMVSFALVAANALTLNALVGRVVRMGVVVTLITASGFYATHVRDLAYDGIPNQIATSITGSGSPVTAADQFDTVAQQVTNLMAGIRKDNTGWSANAIAIGISSWAVELVIKLAIALSAAVWLLGRVLLAVVICYGPWLLLFELFDRTRGWVDQWVGKIVGLLVFQLANAVLTQIVLKAEAAVLTRVHAAHASGPDEALATMLGVIIIFWILAVGMLVLPMVCAIGSGAAAAQGVGTAAAVALPGRAGRAIASGVRAASGSTAGAARQNAVVRQ